MTISNLEIPVNSPAGLGGNMYTSGSWYVKEGKEKEFMSEWGSFARWSVEHYPGGGMLLQDTGDHFHFISIGEWKDAESINRWRQTPEFISFKNKMNDLCEKYDIASFEPVVKVGEIQLV